MGNTPYEILVLDVRSVISNAIVGAAFAPDSADGSCNAGRMHAPVAAQTPASRPAVASPWQPSREQFCHTAPRVQLSMFGLAQLPVLRHGQKPTVLSDCDDCPREPFGQRVDVACATSLRSGNSMQEVSD